LQIASKLLTGKPRARNKPENRRPTKTLRARAKISRHRFRHPDEAHSFAFPFYPRPILQSRGTTKPTKRITVDGGQVSHARKHALSFSLRAAADQPDSVSLFRPT